MKGRNREKGVVAIIAAIFLPFLLAGLGLVFDNGQALDMKRRAQKAADAAALAAAQELRRGNVGTYRAAALENAELNGMPAPEAEINVYNPPITGKRAGAAGYVEVEVRHEAPLYFMRAFYDEPYMVEARAIAGVVSRTNCVLALSEDATPGLKTNGTAYVNLGVCGVHVNSDASVAARADGGGTLIASGIDVVGDYKGDGFTPPPLTGVEPLEDPLSAMTTPDIGKSKCPSSAKPLKVNDHRTLSPGEYCGGIEVTAGATLELEPGIYVLKGGLTVHGGASIKGEEVMFYNTSTPYGPIWFNGGCDAQLSAPKTGPYKGMLFFTDRDIEGGKDNQITGGADSYFSGALYFPKQPLTVIGNAEMEIQKMLIIADTINFGGTCAIEAPSASDLIPYALKAELVY